MHSQKFKFELGSLDNKILITCKLTGISSKIEGPSLPLVLMQEHPLANADNAIACLREIKKQNAWSKIDSQILAGLVLSLLNEHGKLADYPSSSALEANAMLQSAGNDLLRELLEAIRIRWDSAIWNRIPKLSFDLQAYASPELKSFSSIVSRHAKLLRNADKLENLTGEESESIFQAFKQDASKLSNVRPKLADSIHVKAMHQIKESRLSDQIKSSKQLLASVKPIIPVSMHALIKQALQFISLYPKDKMQSLAASLRVCLIGKNSEDGERLAFMLENTEGNILEEQMIGLSETVSPKPMITKTAIDIINERLGKAIDKNGKDQGNA